MPHSVEKTLMFCKACREQKKKKQRDLQKFWKYSYVSWDAFVTGEDYTSLWRVVYATIAGFGSWSPTHRYPDG